MDESNALETFQELLKSIFGTDMEKAKPLLDEYSFIYQSRHAYMARCDQYRHMILRRDKILQEREETTAEIKEPLLKQIEKLYDRLDNLASGKTDNLSGNIRWMSQNEKLLNAKIKALEKRIAELEPMVMYDENDIKQAEKLAYSKGYHKGVYAGRKKLEKELAEMEQETLRQAAKKREVRDERGRGYRNGHIKARYDFLKMFDAGETPVMPSPLPKPLHKRSENYLEAYREGYLVGWENTKIVAEGGKLKRGRKKGGKNHHE